LVQIHSVVLFFLSFIVNSFYHIIMILIIRSLLSLVLNKLLSIFSSSFSLFFFMGNHQSYFPKFSKIIKLFFITIYHWNFFIYLHLLVHTNFVRRIEWILFINSCFERQMLVHMIWSHLGLLNNFVFPIFDQCYALFFHLFDFMFFEFIDVIDFTLLQDKFRAFMALFINAFLLIKLLAMLVFLIMLALKIVFWFFWVHVLRSTCKLIYNLVVVIYFFLLLLLLNLINWKGN
jgi:hypothetical protein